MNEDLGELKKGHPRKLRYHRASPSPPPNDLHVARVGRRTVVLREERDHVTVDSKFLVAAVKLMKQTDLPNAGAVVVVTIDLGQNCGLCDVVATTADQQCLLMPRMLRRGVPKTRKDGTPWLTRWVKAVKPPTSKVSMVLLAPKDNRQGGVVILAAYYGPRTAKDYGDSTATDEDSLFWRRPDGTGHAYALPVDIDQCFEEPPLE